MTFPLLARIVSSLSGETSSGEIDDFSSLAPDVEDVPIVVARVVLRCYKPSYTTGQDKGEARTGRINRGLLLDVSMLP